MPSPSDDDVRERYGLPPGSAVQRSRGPLGDRLRLSPDAFHQRTVTDSAVEWTTWDRSTVVAGATARLTVRGYGVGQGSPVRVTLRDARNQTVGRGQGEMYGGQLIVDVEIERRAAGLAAADVELTELGLKAVSAPLHILPYAELDRAAWGQAEARDGDAVGLSCRVTGTAEGVERIEGLTAEVEIQRGEAGAALGRLAGGSTAGGDGATAPLFEPVVTLRVPVTGGRIEATWQLGYDAEGKAQIVTQPEFDDAAQRTGGTAETYRRPVWRFCVRVAGLEAESPEMSYRDHVELAWGDDTERPAADAPVEVRLADGATRRETLDAGGRLRLDDVPPGPVEAIFGPDPRPWQPEGEWTQTGADEPLALTALPQPPEPTVRPAPPVLLASAGSDLSILADIARGQDEDEDGFIEWLWGTLKGDFNEDPSYSQIIATMSVTWIPVVDQIADFRDIAAGIYLVTRRDDQDKKWAWFALVVTLVGIFPVFGSLLKGVFRIVAKGLKTVGSGGLDVAADVLRRVFQHIGQGDPAAWARALDRGRILTHAQNTFQWAADYVVYMFRWAQERAASGLVRAHEAAMGAAVDLGYSVADGFRRVLGQTPAERVVRSTRSLADKLGEVASSMERLQREANLKIASVLDELFDGLGDLLERAGRDQIGGGVSGGVVRPGHIPDDELFPDGTWRPRRASGYDHDGEFPGPLADIADRPDRNFRGMRYNARVLEEDVILYRGGEAGGRPLGSWYTREPPTSAASVRIDSAVRDVWTDPQTGAWLGQSPVDWVYPVRIPKGTTIYEGPVGSQGGVHLGGADRMQIYIEEPWLHGAVAQPGYPIPRP